MSATRRRRHWRSRQACKPVKVLFKKTEWITVALSARARSARMLDRASACGASARTRDTLLARTQCRAHERGQMGTRTGRVVRVVATRQVARVRACQVCAKRACASACARSACAQARCAERVRAGALAG